MSRNGSGTYTLPSGNPVVSGTLIEASWANTTLDDLASAMTDSLSRTGQGGMQAALRLYDGTSSVPGLAWGSETTTGWYRAGAGDMRLVVTGSQVVKYLATGVDITGTLSASGNTTVGGTLGVTGASTFTGAATFNGGISGSPVINAGTANGVAYLNGSKVLTTGSALTFDGVNLATNTGGTNATLGINSTSSSIYLQSRPDISYSRLISSAYQLDLTTVANQPISFGVNNAEAMRLTSTGLGIGTSSPGYKLDVLTPTASTLRLKTSTATAGTGTILFEIANNFSGVSQAYIQGNGPGNSGLSYLTFGVSTTAGATTATEVMRLDSSGNLGLGVTPSAWGSNWRAINFGYSSGIGQLAATSGGSGEVALVSSAYNNNTNWLYFYTGSAASKYSQVSGQHQWFTAASGTAGNAISFTQAMTLDASGNLGVGTTSPNSKLNVNNGFLQIDISGTQAVRIGSSDSIIGGTDNNAVIQANTSKATIFLAGGSERARIDSSGNLLVGKAVTTYTTDGLWMQPNGTYWASRTSDISLALNRNGTDGQTAQFYKAGTQVGNISVTGSATAYNTSSDYRLKHDITPMAGALAKVAALKPVTYKWKVDGSDGEGFIAHELAEVVPQCVTGEKDAVDAEGNPVYQGIDTSFLVATLTAAIQEQQAIINQLKARLDAANL